LQPEGQAAGREAAGNRDARQAGEVDADGVNVGQIHRERISGFLAEPEGRYRRGGRQQRVAVAQDGGELVADKGADLLGAQIIGVVVAAAQHVRAEDDASFHLRAEAFGARPGVDVDGVLRRRRPVAVADAVVTRQVRRGLGGGDQVVDGHGVFRRQRERHLFDFTALFSVELNGLSHGRADLGVKPGAEKFPRHAQPPRAFAPDQLGPVVRHVRLERGRIARVVPGDGAEQQRRVLHGVRHGADLIERRGKGRQAVARHQPVGRFEADDAAQCGRLADGAAGVRAEGERQFTRRDRGRRASRAATRHAGQIPRVGRRPEGRVLRRGAHGELVHVQPAKQDRARRLELLRHGGVVGRHEVRQHFARTGQRLAFDGDDILKADGDAVERSSRLSRRTPCVRSLGQRQGSRLIIGVERPHAAIDRLGAGKARLQQFHRGDFPRGEQRRQPGG
jgi:hypothetical protein